MSAKPNTVYFARQIGVRRGPVKIGCSHNPASRLAELSVWSPVPLEFAATMPGSFREEHKLHSYFRATLSHREWFHWSQELQDVIDAVRSGNFDINDLPPPVRLRRRGWSDESKLRATASYIRWRRKGVTATSATLRVIDQIIELPLPLEERRKLIVDELSREASWEPIEMRRLGIAPEAAAA